VFAPSARSCASVFRTTFTAPANCPRACGKTQLVEDAYGSQILGRLNRAPRFIKWMADVIRPYVGEKVLEIGAGTGNLTLQLVPRQSFVAYLSGEFGSRAWQGGWHTLNERASSGWYPLRLYLCKGWGPF